MTGLWIHPWAPVQNLIKRHYPVGIFLLKVNIFLLEGGKKYFCHVLNKLSDHWLNVSLSNQIVGFFDHQYLWKERSCVLNFLHRNSFQKKASYSTAVGCVWPDMPSHAQTFFKPVCSWLWLVWRLHSLIKKWSEWKFS